MNIILNGKQHTTKAHNISALVAELGLNIKQVAIEKNREIVPRSLHEKTPLAEGDRLEVLAFVGGG